MAFRFFFYFIGKIAFRRSFEQKGPHGGGHANETVLN